jgi:hypothetical protein
MDDFMVRVIELQAIVEAQSKQIASLSRRMDLSNQRGGLMPRDAKCQNFFNPIFKTGLAKTGPITVGMDPEFMEEFSGSLVPLGVTTAVVAYIPLERVVGEPCRAAANALPRRARPDSPTTRDR